MSLFRRVILESPYAGDVEANLDYCRLAMKDCLARGEAPFPSHALYTQPGVLDDADPGQRELGMEAGFAWGEIADYVVVYEDRGMSNGMLAGIERHIARGMLIVYRAFDRESGKFRETSRQAPDGHELYDQVPVGA